MGESILVRSGRMLGVVQLRVGDRVFAVPVQALDFASDRVRVRPGETVPTDGRVTEGLSTIDESLVTVRGRAAVPREVLQGGPHAHAPVALHERRGLHPSLFFLGWATDCYLMEADGNGFASHSSNE